jgi:hypothetical protein
LRFLSRVEIRGRGAGIERLFVTDWGGSLAVIAVALVALFFAFGYWWPYWRVGDMDIWMVYEAFLFNDGLRQEYFDHPAYLTILLLGEWFALLHRIGLLPAHALSALPPVTDISASGLAWMRAVQAARVLSLFIGLGFLTSFAFLTRRLVNNWRVATLATFALVFSGGFMMESRIVRTELIAAGFGYVALLLTLVAAQRPASNWRPVMIGVAAFCATLAMLNKVHIVFLVTAIAPLAFFFGRPNEASPPAWRSRGGTMAMAGFIAAAALAALAAWPIVMSGLFDPAALAARLRIFGTGFPFYQTLIVIWVCAWIAAYAVHFRVGAQEGVSAAAAVVAGVGLGLLVLAIRRDVGNIVVVMNPFEKLLSFASASAPDLVHSSGISSGSFGNALLSGFGLLLARQTFFLSTSPRPTIFLEWAVIAAMVFVWRRGDRRTVYQAGVLIAAGLAIDLVGTFRGLKLEYFIISDPLTIIAGAWVLARTPALQTHRLAGPAVFALLALTVSFGLAEPVKHSFKRDMPLDFCVPHYPYTKRIETFSFCPR